MGNARLREVNQLEHGRTTRRGGAGIRTHTHIWLQSRATLANSPSDSTCLKPNDRLRLTGGVCEEQEKVLSGKSRLIHGPEPPPDPARPAPRSKVGHRPHPATFRTRLPGWYPRPLPLGGGPLPLHAPRVPPSCVFGFHSKSPGSKARDQTGASSQLRASLRVPDVHAPAAPAKAQKLAQAQLLLAPAFQRGGARLCDPEVLLQSVAEKGDQRAREVEGGRWALCIVCSDYSLRP